LSGLFQVELLNRARLLRLTSADGMNRLTRASVMALTETIRELASEGQPLIIAGNPNFFSVGADLNEIASLCGPEAHEFSKMGQTLMDEIEQFPAPVYAAIEGHCMGGGLDLALACHRRIASPNALFGHRGAALGLVTGWGGTQRLPRLIGRARALQMFVAAETITAEQALSMGLVDAVSPRPGNEAIARLEIS
jgi:enoyl-CoA hydratase/carnithine racemase